MKPDDFSKVRDALKVVPIPEDNDGPVFGEPWEAQAFAMAVHLHERGKFEWTEWAETLSEVIKSNETNGVEKQYYEHWLEALEAIATKSQLATSNELETEQSAWREAAAATPHGEPIELMRQVTNSRPNITK